MGALPGPMRAALLAACLAVLTAIGAAAQAPEIDYDAWSQTVQEVERVTEADRASDEQLADLRADLVVWRERLNAAVGVNAERIERLQAQIDALGTTPTAESGQTEPPEIARQRDALQDELDALTAPRARARASAAEADALIAQIDAELRLRKADRILTRWPTPLNPLSWTVPISELRTTALAIPAEVIDNLDDAESRQAVLRNLPSAALSLILGTAFVFRTRYWAARVTHRVNSVERRPVRRALRLLISMTELAVPLIGIGMLLGGIQLTGLPGPTGTALLSGLSAFGVIMIVGTWLARQFFPPSDGARTPLMMDEAYVARARWLTRGLVTLLATRGGLRMMAEQLDLSGETIVYWSFVLSLAIAYVLLRIARLFRKSIAAARAEDSDNGFSRSVVLFVANACSLLCIAAPVAGLAGYVALTTNLIVPAAWTFLLFGFLALAQRAVAGFYAIMVRAETDGESGLVPTLVGVVLLVAALPVLALVWGAEPTDLAEAWTRLRAGVAIGDVRVAPSQVVALIVVFAVFYALTRLLQAGLRNAILPKTRLDQGSRTALVSGTGYIGIFLATVAAITSAGIDLSNLAIFASALAVGIGFGLQTIVSNFVSGIILLIERPVSEGDWIEVGGKMGYVRRISVRATRIETFDRTNLIVPNSDLVSGVVTNWTLGSAVGRVIVPVSVEFGTDTRRVHEILDEIAMAHPLTVLSPPPQILFRGFNDFAMLFEIRAIISDVNWVLDVLSDMNHEIVRRFTEEGIVIPYPQRDLWMRSAGDGDETRATDDHPVLGARRRAARARPGDPDAADSADAWMEPDAASTGTTAD